MSGLSSCGGSSGAGGILVLHADTSTIEFTLFAVSSGKALTRAMGGRLDGLNTDARFHAEDASGRTVIQVDCADEKPPGHRIAIEFLFNWLEQHAGAVPVLAVGHCVLHGGLRFSGPVRIDAATLRYLQGLVPRAPARQRPSVAAIRVIARRLPELPQVACFETAFYLDVPVLEQAPLSKQALHRYGYDGLSFESVIDALPVIDARAAGGRTIVVHVGDAVSLCALAGGRRVAMVMGFGDPEGSPAMRSPGLDPGLVGDLMTESRMGSLQVRELLRQRSALLGASGIADALDRLVCSNEPRARLAVGFLLYRVSRALESLVGALAGLDAIVFTAAGGPHAVPIRAALCRKASALGLELDPAANQAGGPRLTLPGSHVTAWVIPIDKRLLVARRTQTFLG